MSIHLQQTKIYYVIKKKKKWLLKSYRSTDNSKHVYPIGYDVVEGNTSWCLAIQPVVACFWAELSEKMN